MFYKAVLFIEAILCTCPIPTKKCWFDLSSHGSMPKVMDDIDSDEEEVEVLKKKVN